MEQARAFNPQKANKRSTHNLLLYADVESGELPESKEITYAKLLHNVDVELGRYLNVQKGHIINCCFMWTLNLVGT